LGRYRFADLELPVADYPAGIVARVETLLRLPAGAVTAYGILKASPDARDKGNLRFVLTLWFEVPNGVANKAISALPKKLRDKLTAVGAAPAYALPPLPPVRRGRAAVVVGAGPAGLFCALTLLRGGIAPVIVERGEDVDGRRKAVAAFTASRVLNGASNMQFGEGGAGAFSDGKLSTGTHDARGSGVLADLVAFGAPPEILYEAKPHIGTDRLPGVVKALRRYLEAGGVSVRFHTRLVGLSKTAGDAVCGAVVERQDGGRECIPCDALVLAIGHSARDTAAMLVEAGAAAAAKPFAVGVRIEHAQADINRAQLGEEGAKCPTLCPADYKLAVHPQGARSLYTFCMCPGGTVVNASSEDGLLCTNGMSAYARDGINANSALLVPVTPSDFGTHPLSGIAFQRRLERAAFAVSGDYRAPAQRVEDFFARRATVRFASVAPSFTTGVTGANLWNVLPPYVAEAICAGLPLMGKRLHGFDGPDAVLTAVEARSSSPVRFTRGKTYQSNLPGLYPCGEGAGYAGGILSAAVDGIKVADSILSEK
jgi:uncharacterized FAD-dependent dehydrogenase